LDADERRFFGLIEKNIICTYQRKSASYLI
jgi:hypothetical protein